MKTKPTLQTRGAARLWAGLLAVLLVACTEFWMVFRFSCDWARATAQEDPTAQFPMPGVQFVSR